VSNYPPCGQKSKEKFHVGAPASDEGLSFGVAANGRGQRKTAAVSVRGLFLLEKDVKPDKVTLNLVVRGERIVWIIETVFSRGLLQGVPAAKAISKKRKE
jgi:hypothetical protein